MNASLRALTAGAFALCSIGALASPVRYDFTSTLAPVAPNTGSDFSGYVQFDSSLLAPNAVINVASFTDWKFQWGNDFTYGIGSDHFDPAFATFDLGASLQALSVDLCFSAAGICDTGHHPVARVQTTVVYATYDAAGAQTSGAGSWSGPIAQVPEPTTMSLVGLALVGLALTRRHRA